MQRLFAQPRKLLGLDCNHPLFSSLVRLCQVPKTGSTFCLTLGRDLCLREFDQVYEKSVAHGAGIQQQEGAAAGSNHTPSALAGNEALSMIGLQHGCAVLTGVRMSCFTRFARGHRPLPLSIRSADCNAIIIVRDPVERAISACLHTTHHEGMPPQVFSNLLLHIKDLQSAECKPNKGKHVENFGLCINMVKLRVYLMQNAFKGCFTKTLNGIGCAANATITQDMVDTATSRLQGLFLVGVQEDWNYMITLFHRIRGNPSVNPEELVHARENQHTVYKQGARKLAKALQYEDPFDLQVHQAGIQVYLETWAKHGSSAEHAARVAHLKKFLPPSSS